MDNSDFNTEIPPHLTAAVDQDHAAAAESLLTHIVAAAEMMSAQGYTPEAVWVRFAHMFEDRHEKYDPRTVARLAAAAIVHLAEAMPCEKVR